MSLEGKWVAQWDRHPKVGWKPLDPPKSGRARELWAKEMVRREPYDLHLQRYENPNLAKIGLIWCKRKRTGGVWHCSYNHKLLTAETLELLYLKVVEAIDKENLRRCRGNLFAPLREVSLQDRARCTGNRDPELETLFPDMNPKSRFLPSEIFYHDTHREP